MEVLASLANRITGPVMTTIGLFTNALAFIVYSKMSRSNSNGSFCFFLQSLCIMDSITLLGTSFFFIVFGYQVDILGIPILCKLINYLAFIGACSSWVEAISSLDRALYTICPNRFRTIRKNRKLCLLLVICSVAYNLAFYSPLFYYFRVDYDNDSVAYCVADDTAFMVYTWLDLFNAGLLPFLIMLACSLAIFNRLSRSRVNLEESNTSNNRMTKRKKKDIQFALTSCGLNLFFFITYAGFGIFILIQASGIPLFNQYATLYLALWYIFLLNFSGKFFIYLLVNRSFRNQFFSMVNIFINWLTKILS